MKNLLILALVFLVGCGARHKTVEAIKTRSSYELAADSAFSFLNTLRSQSLMHYNASVDEKNRVIEYDGQPGDSLSLDEYGPDGELVSRTVIHGKGKAVLSEGTKQEQVKTSENTQSQEQQSGQASGSRKGSLEATEEHLKKDVSGRLLSYWWVLLILGALWYLNKRYGWWDSIKSHVTSNKNQ